MMKKLPFIVAASAGVFGAYYYYSTKVVKTLLALNPKEFTSFKVSQVRQVSPNTKIVRFELPKNHSLGLPVSSCVVVCHDSDPAVMRPYTPITTERDLGYFELLVKVYPNGVMSQIINGLKPGDSLNFKGPITKLPYKENMKSKIGMIAGGTGITPMLQVIKEVLHNKNDKTELSLLFANNSEEDILLRNELDDLQSKHSNFKVKYVLSKPSKDWKGLTGFISEDMINEYMPKSDDSSMVLVCGPPGFMTHVSGPKAKDYSQGTLSGLLKSLKYNETNVFKY